MKPILNLIILFAFFSCNHQENAVTDKTIENSTPIKPKKAEIKKSTDKPIKKYKPEYPLTNFFYNDNIIQLGKRESYFPEGVTDLKIDTTGGRLIISFDREGGIGCPLEGQIDRRIYWNDTLDNDTIYLDFFQNCDGIDDPITESIELRLYYQITDELSYKNAFFIPRFIRR